MWCTNCKKSRHTKEYGWKSNGKPPTSSKEWGYQGEQQKSYSQVHLTEQANPLGKKEQEGLSVEEIERLRGFIGSLENPSSACSLALSSKCLLPFGLHASEKCFENSWIIDSGATEHIAYSSQLFSAYKP